MCSQTGFINGVSLQSQAKQKWCHITLTGLYSWKDVCCAIAVRLPTLPFRFSVVPSVGIRVTASHFGNIQML